MLISLENFVEHIPIIISEEWHYSTQHENIILLGMTYVISKTNH